MKILKLELLAYGPFTNCELPFAPGKSGLHIVFGLNEAGKSSALRGLRHALYGIPENTSDDFLHAGKNLRLGVTLERAAGQQLSFIRRKGRVRTLLDVDNSTPLDDAVLQPYLGSVNQHMFETMFGIDHAALKKGGSEIVHFEGELGKVLFGAMGGIADLQDVQKQLRKDADDLFVPAGKKPRLNAALSALEHSKKALRDAHIPSKQFADLTTERDRLRELKEKLTGDLHERQREQARLARIKAAIPHQARLRELHRQLGELNGIRLLPQDFPQRRIKAVADLDAAKAEDKFAAERRQQLTTELQNIRVPQELIDHGLALDELSTQLGSHSKAQRDLPSLCDQRDGCLRLARERLAELRPDLPLDEAGALKLTKAQRMAIQNLGNRHAALTAEVKQVEAELQNQLREIAQCQAQLARLAPARDTTSLRAALSRVAGQGQLEKELADALKHFQANERQAAIDLSTLPLWSGQLDDLEQLSVPGLETIDTHDDSLKATAKEAERLREALAQHEADLAAIRQELERLRLAEGQVPSEADLMRIRTLREQGWQLVKRAWLDKKKEADEIAAFAAQLQFGADLPTAYELSVRSADETVDRLRRESDRVARRAQLEVEQKSKDDALQKVKASLATAHTALEAATRNWLALWQPLGIAPGAPKEMRSWLKQQEALVRQTQDLRAAQQGIDNLQARIAAARQDLARALAEIGEAAPAECESLVALQQRADSRALQLEDAHRQRIQLEKDVDRLTVLLESERRHAQAAQDELAAWQKEWRTALEPLGLPADALPSQANEVLQQVTELLDEISKAKGLDERITSIHRDATAFTQDVRDLAERVKVPAAGATVEPLARQLIALWQQAGRHQAQRKAFEDELAQHDKKLAAAQQIITRRQSELAAMCQEAGCTTPDLLPDLERDSERLRELRALSDAKEESLTELAGGLSLAEFEAEVAACNPDDLPARLDRIRTEIESLSNELDQVVKEQGGVDEKLRSMDGEAKANEEALQVQNLLARIGDDSLEYARLRLAAYVLQAAIDRFREKNQGPMLQLASQHFADLTCARYSGLQVAFDEDNGQARLVGVRTADEKAVPVDAMSEGTADQLYLALRLASLEVYSQHQEPMPLVVDDVLIQFDNQRAAATLRALASLARRNQVILFTHHEHLLELAASVLAPDEFSVQHLAS